MTRHPRDLYRNGHDFDVIVIGSGMGGLAAASLLTQIGGKKVLVLERHFKLGGFLHSFRRRNYVWDPGVHYVGEMQSGSLTRRCMDLVTGGNVDWHALESPFEQFIFPNEIFAVPTDAKQYQQRLSERFPSETSNIKRYFRDVTSVQNWSHRWFFSKQFGPPFSHWMSAGRKLAMRNTRDYLNNRFDDPLLRAIVTAQWPDYGTPPGESAFGVHATVAADFFNGGYYPVGGSQAIADTAAAVVQHGGGDCLVNHCVQEIIVNRNRACGVIAEHKGTPVEFRAPVIISAAGGHTTFAHLLPENLDSVEKQQASRLAPGTSAVILFLGLNDDPRRHGFRDCNYWIYRGIDHDAMAQRAEVSPDEFHGGFLSFGSLRNPGQEPHTAQIVSFSRERAWESFAHRPWMKRGSQYEQQKRQTAAALIDFVEQRLPGLKKLIDYQELSSPLTIKSFTGHPGGAIYGQACTPDRLLRDRWHIGTSIKGLFLTGSDVGLPGVNGALMAGVMTAGKLLGWTGMPRIMHRAFASASKTKPRAAAK